VVDRGVNGYSGITGQLTCPREARVLDSRNSVALHAGVRAHIFWATHSLILVSISTAQ
jgi:hypothetical protein